MKVDLRKPTEDDMNRFRECLALDSDHAGQDADNWMATPGELMTFYDTHGHRVWVRIERALRVHVQHDPAVSERDQVPLFYRAFQWLKGAARTNGFCEVIFESKAQPLIDFFKRRFGFAETEHDYSVRLDGASSAVPRALKRA